MTSRKEEADMSLANEPLHFDALTLLSRAVPAPVPSSVPRIGTVTLVGAGPGDAELLTVKAARAIAAARVVLFDALVGEGVMQLVPRGARRIDVGKRCAKHTLSQEGIIELLIGLAHAGHDVLRLKGGDPFIFGRGGEEIEALAAAGVPWQVIPGISAAQGAAAALGLPLTHRDHAATLVLATGHLRDGPPGERTPDLDWARLARPGQTVVIYMGVGALARICDGLIAHGLPRHTPAATVERATQPGQRLVSGTLETLPLQAAAQGVKPPALIVIGGVVGIAERLAVACQAARQAEPKGPGVTALLTQDRVI
jgi:uroporphyrin-III C-methyltransferase